MSRWSRLLESGLESVSASSESSQAPVFVVGAPRSGTHLLRFCLSRHSRLHVGPETGLRLCDVEHVGMVLSGTATAAFEDGRVVELKRGDLFHIPSDPHDSWVVGDEPYVSLHFLGAEKYAKSPRETEG